MSTWTITEAMEFCRFTDRKSFFQICARRGAPVVIINARVFRYDPVAFEAWWDGLSLEEQDWWRSMDQ